MQLGHCGVDPYLREISLQRVVVRAWSFFNGGERKERAKLTQQIGDVHGNDSPDDIVINPVILVRENVAGRHDDTPGDLRMIITELLR